MDWVKIKRLRILIININNAEYTANCMADLRNQSCQDFDILIVDNGSDPKTHNILNQFSDRAKIQFNGKNLGVNPVWNQFAEQSKGYPFLCFLNNDVRLSKYFVADTLMAFEQNPKVGIVNHPTNHLNYQKSQPFHEFKKVFERYKQGWDFTMHRLLYVPIPDCLKIYCGDDWLFHKVFEAGYMGGFATSSPIVHFQGASTRYGNQVIQKNNSDFITFTEVMKEKHYLRHLPQYSNIKPTFKDIIE